LPCGVARHGIRLQHADRQRHVFGKQVPALRTDLAQLERRHAARHPLGRLVDRSVRDFIETHDRISPFA
jgi:hypothetical protein